MLIATTLKFNHQLCTELLSLVFHSHYLRYLKIPKTKQPRFLLFYLCIKGLHHFVSHTYTVRISGSSKARTTDFGRVTTSNIKQLLKQLYSKDIHNLNSLQVFAIELVTFAINFVLLAVKFGTFAVEFVGFAVEFVALALQFVALADAFAMGLGSFALELALADAFAMGLGSFALD